MVDLAALVIALLVVVVVFLRKTSSGVAILALLAGVMLDQLIGGWVLGFLPDQNTVNGQYVSVVVHLLITFTPVVATLVAVKVSHYNAVLALLGSLLLGFLITFFGLQIVAPLPAVSSAAKNSGLLHFLEPYQNAILASAGVLALVEMVMSHRSKLTHSKKKK